MFIGMHVSNKKVIKQFENITMVSGVVNGIECVWTEQDSVPIETDHIGFDEAALEDYETLVRYRKEMKCQEVGRG